ncbi:copper resistance protein NlpE N-terminal domain-containing protein, partial [Acinetobacter baumannii]|uniref:copper resistance protein NlpE N-terminal domain-containing protein n=1 Tax=Acinetobacter baumannii TaxID=470 RepID=UPI000EEF3CE6
GMLAYVAGVQRKEIRGGIACVKHQAMAGSDIGDANPFETHGKFTFDKDNTSVITLDDKAQNRKFFIGENTATALDMEGKKVEGSLAEHYVLKKED